MDFGTGCSDETIEASCSICYKSGKMVEALKHCIECGQYYCKSCAENHNTDYAQHNLLDQLEFVSFGWQTMSTEKCSVHRTELLDKYCAVHDDIGCTTCMGLEHKCCSDIRLISDVVKTLDTKKNDRTEIDKKLTKASKRIDGVKKNQEKMLIQLQKSRKGAICKVKSFRKHLDTVLAQLEKASITEIEAEFDKDEISVRNQLQYAEDHAKKLEQASKALRITEGNEIQTFVSMKYAAKLLRTDKLRSACSEDAPLTQVKVDYKLNVKFYKSLKELQTFGCTRVKKVAPFHAFNPNSPSQQTKVLDSKSRTQQKDRQLVGLKDTPSGEHESFKTAHVVMDSKRHIKPKKGQLFDLKDSPSGEHRSFKTSYGAIDQKPRTKEIKRISVDLKDSPLGEHRSLATAYGAFDHIQPKERHSFDIKDLPSRMHELLGTTYDESDQKRRTKPKERHSIDRIDYEHELLRTTYDENEHLRTTYDVSDQKRRTQPKERHSIDRTDLLLGDHDILGATYDVCDHKRRTQSKE